VPEKDEGHGGRFTQLDPLRFVAIVPVLVDHVWQPDDLPWIFGGLRVGEVGVRLFFVLSGFLITGILVRGARTPTSSSTRSGRETWARSGRSASRSSSISSGRGRSSWCPGDGCSPAS